MGALFSKIRKLIKSNKKKLIVVNYSPDIYEVSSILEMMATIVLTGLIYHICEMYIDDCIVYGNTEGEFVSHLR